MRGRNRWSMAVLGLGLGLGLGLSGTVSTAFGGDEPSAGPTQAKAGTGSTWGHGHWWLKSGVCPKCAEMSQNSRGVIPPAPTAMTATGSGRGDCSVCDPSGRVVHRTYPGTPVLAGASVSAASRVLVTPRLTPPAVNPSALASNGAVPPGFAVVGESNPASEPEPIGVMRTDYRQGPALGASTSYAAGRASTWDGSNAPGRASTGLDPTMGLIPPPSLQGGRRSHVLRTLLVGRFENNRRLDRQRQAHAAISYGDASQNAKEIPASMVYGR